MHRRQLLIALPALVIASDGVGRDGKGGYGKGGKGGRGSAGDGWLSPSSPNAIALGYSTEHSRVDTRRWPKKAAANGSQQRCGTCALFRAGAQGGGQCSLFTGQRVRASGWCNAWTKR